MGSNAKLISLEFIVEPEQGANVHVRGRGADDDLFTAWALGSVAFLDKIGMPVDKPMPFMGVEAALLKAAEIKKSDSVLIDLKELRKQAGCD